jgi:hypothetical protein
MSSEVTSDAFIAPPAERDASRNSAFFGASARFAWQDAVWIALFVFSADFVDRVR